MSVPLSSTRNAQAHLTESGQGILFEQGKQQYAAAVTPITTSGWICFPRTSRTRLLMAVPTPAAQEIKKLRRAR